MSAPSVTALDRDGAVIRLTNAVVMGNGLYGERDGGAYAVTPAAYGSVWPTDEAPSWVSAARVEATPATLGQRYGMEPWAVIAVLDIRGEWRDSQNIASLGYGLDEAHGILAIMRAQYEAGL